MTSKGPLQPKAIYDSIDSKRTVAIVKIHLNTIKQSFQNTFKYSNTISPVLPARC